MFLVMLRQSGPEWDRSRPLEEQSGWPEHAAFMDGLEEEGFVVLGGPLGDGELEFLFLVDAESTEAIHARLAADPWTPMGVIRIARVDPWQLLLGRAP